MFFTRLFLTLVLTGIFAVSYTQNYLTRVYSANYGSNTITVIDPEKKVVIDNIIVGNKPSDIAASSNGEQLYVVSYADKSLTLIDPVTNKVTKTITLDGNPRRLALSSDDAFLLISLEDKNAIAVYDVKSEKITRTLSTGKEPSDLAVSLDGKEIYTSCSGDGSIVISDMATGMVTGTVDLNTSPRAMTLLSDGRLVVTARWLNGIIIIDPLQRKVLSGWLSSEFDKSFPVSGGFMSGLCSTVGDSGLIVVSEAERLIYDIDLKSEPILLGLSPTGKGPVDVAASPNGKTIFVSCFADNTVWAYDLVLHSPMWKIEVGANPRSIIAVRVRVNR